MNTAFLCDSTLQVSEEFCNNYPVFIVPLEVRLDDNVYEDNIDIKPAQFYESLKKGMKPSTSQPSVGKILSVLENLKNKGVTNIIIFSVSDKLSGTYSSFNQAVDLIDGMVIKIINTNQVSRIVGRAIEKLVRDFSNGSISYDEIEDEYRKLEVQQNVLVTVESMDYLYAGGRLNKAQFIFSNMLNILPIITLKDGTLSVSGKHRGLKKIISKICNEIKEKNPKSLVILHTHSEELLNKITDCVKEVFGEIKTEVILVSPVIGTHTGPRAFGIGYLQYED